MTDPDAPIPYLTITHWIVYNIPAHCTSLPEGISDVNARENGIRFGRRFSGKYSYLGPCPPFGTHRYRFTIWALDTTLPLEPNQATRKSLTKALQGHILASGELSGFFSK